MTPQSEDHKAEVRHYLVGFALALTLTLLPFALVAWGGLARMQVLTIVAICALVQIVVHFRYFLHIDFSRQKSEDLHLILFSALVLAIMACGTLWIVFNLAGRM
ncbi:cytochrome o ubiquinol oxidase subunit IV [Sedimentitalea todarodis]|uniref:Cytochrome bo(3) ubiquinol oxidase subunit 4 n=1 Tax=Sedimentitalea todarodis TaxID=1631240 RepID=A0ABU3VEI0_9RHOB|nr:cytochrome o ubiquinol oxidase subunit IV [Sedimentitalea todarodis]MDU9004587.1 cytochrome o ubiquinol oxidase subunit IV [Sedimentitalea todarodis]